MPQTRVDSWEAFDMVERVVENAVADGVKQAAEDELEASERAYDAETDVLGRPWKPLSPVTIRKKGHDTILVESGNMRDSGFVESDRDAMSAKVGYRDSKVPIHEYGTEDIPARPIVGPMRIDLEHNRLEETVKESVSDRIGQMNLRRMI